MDFNFTEVQLMLKETIRTFCKKELNKQYVKWLDENVSFIPQELWDKLADIGYFGLRIPKEYGGSGMTFTDYIVACEELATASTAVAFCAGLSQDFGGDIISKLGTKEQKEFFLPQIAAGKLKFSLALTEPAGGTDILGALKTTAEKKGDQFVINGQKVFITGAHVADYMLVVAITDPKVKEKHRGLSVLIVDTKTPGINIVPIKKLGVHACGTNEVFLDNVNVPAERILGEINKGWYHLTDIMNPERIVTSVFSLGIAKAAYQEALEYSQQRYAFNKPIGQFQVIQHYLVDMLIAIENARNLIYKCCWLYEQGQPVHLESTMAKIVAGYASEVAAIKGLEIFGGYGYTMDYNIQRYFRDYKQMIFAPIADEMAKNMIGEWIGLPRSF
jgi:acyl-CoA dehydrogenase